jgi:hypothetical protein
MPRTVDVLRQHKVAILFTAIGIILSPFAAFLLDEYIRITPKMLSEILEDDKVSVLDRVLNITEGAKSKANVLEFNDISISISKRFEDSFQNSILNNRPYSDTEIQQILSRCDIRARAAVLIMATTGMRIDALRDMEIFHYLTTYLK